MSSLEQTYEESLIIMNRVQYKLLARLIENTTLKKLQKVGIIITMLSSIVHHWTYLPTYPPYQFDISRTTIIFTASNPHTARAWLRGCQYIITTKASHGINRHKSETRGLKISSAGTMCRVELKLCSDDEFLRPKLVATLRDCGAGISEEHQLTLSNSNSSCETI